MTAAFPEQTQSPQQVARAIWKRMSVGPALFFFWLLTFGAQILLLSYGVDSKWLLEPTDDSMVGDILLMTLTWLAPLSVMAFEIAGVRAAYNRQALLEGTSFESHAVSAIRTFWVMFWAFAGAVCLSLMLLAIPNIGAIGFGLGVMFIMAAVLPLLFLWNSFRVVRGWRRANEGKPVTDRPTRWS